MMSQADNSKAPRVLSSFNADATALEVIAGKDLHGKSVIVTGGASGIGVETARALTIAGADVVLAVRNLAAGQKVANTLNREVGDNRVRVEELNLARLDSVRAFALRWGEKPLTILINNAGVMACPQDYTEDGFEMQFGTNHLGHFLLAKLLTPVLKRGSPSRVISVSSAGHQYGDINFKDPHFRKSAYTPFAAYGQSKTANALFAVEYDRRNKNEGIRAFSLMPGVIKTRLGRHMTPEIRAAVGLPSEDGLDALYRNVEQGAATSVWAAVATELEGRGGLYLEDCAEALPFSKDLPQARGVMPHALNPESAKRLWDLSEKEVQGVFSEH